MIEYTIPFSYYIFYILILCCILILFKTIRMLKDCFKALALSHKILDATQEGKDDLDSLLELTKLVKKNV